MLDEAANLIDKYGWLRGGYGDYRRGFCTSGAITAAGLKLKVDTTDAFRVAGGRLPRRTGISGFLSLEAWNDGYAEDKDEVVGFLHDCANTWRTEEGKPEK